jgi:LysM repeat protein
MIEAYERLPLQMADRIRYELARLSNQRIFSPQPMPDEPLTTVHTVVAGQYLSDVARRYGVPYELIERINRIKASRIRVGQRLKVLKGPLHAWVDKSEYRMDIYATEPAGAPAYLCSFEVGLGAGNSTPTGEFVVPPQGKLKNPGWTNPRTNRTYHRDDPENPIGEYWVALARPGSEQTSGYGIHGTIDPNSVGKQRSMGCIRLRDQDVELVYIMLSDGLSRVRIVP